MQEPELWLAFEGAGAGWELTLCTAAGRRGPWSRAQSATAGGLRSAPAMQLEGNAPSRRLGLEARYHLRLSQRVHEHACEQEQADLLSNPAWHLLAPRARTRSHHPPAGAEGCNR